MRLHGSAAFGFAALFVLLGLPFLARTGLHVDAAYELACFYSCSPPLFKATLWGRDMPLMVIQYLGALKAWLYLPILYFNPTTFLLRLPLLLVGGASVWMAYALLHRISGRAAAVAAALLLATDPSFLLATGLDFGPIALLHFFLLAGILLLLRFDRTQSRTCLAAAFFLFGLALWHKALFIWMLAGLAAASAVVFPKRLLELFTAARLAIAGFALCLGAFPLLYYNVMTGGATLRTQDVMSAVAPVSQKWLILKNTVDGSALFGFLTEESQRIPSLTPSLPERISIGLNHSTGDLGSTWMWHALLAACVLLPWLWFTSARRPAIFVLVHLALTWAQMAAVPNAGAALHHAILLWPFPHFLVAIAGSQLAATLKRPAAWVLAGVLALLVASNGLVLNRYYAHLTTRGPAVLFTDAVSTLSHYLRNMTGKQFVTVDWGYSPTLCLLSAGQLPIEDISNHLLAATERPWIQWLLAQPGKVFIGHAPESEQLSGIQERLDAIAAQAGYEKEVLVTISDRKSNPRFLVMRYLQAGGGSSPTAAPRAPFVITASNPDHEGYLTGFHPIENEAWRWTKREFAVTLGRPASGSATLTLDLHIPRVVIERLGPVTLSASAGPVPLTAQTYTQPGDHRFLRELTALPPEPAVTLRFAVDKFFSPGQADARELGVIVKSVALR